MANEQDKTHHSERRPRRHKKNRTRRLPNIFFCGDPHGDVSHINKAAEEYKPDAMVILGDIQPSGPLHEILAPALKYTQIWWIPGNHDTDSDEFYEYLWKSELAHHNLNGRVANVCGLRIAGLGGVFRGQVWMPDSPPNYYCPASFLRRVGSVHLWKGGLPRRHRSTIFPSIYSNMLEQKADVLVTHEAPGCHRRGFEAIDRLALSMHAKWMFHGHQHEDRVYGPYKGMEARAVGYRGIVNLAGEVVVAAQMDPREVVQVQNAIDWASRNYVMPEEPEWFQDEMNNLPFPTDVPEHLRKRCGCSESGIASRIERTIAEFSGTPEEKVRSINEEVKRRTPPARFNLYRRHKMRK